jgi:hypothetical protein
MMFLFDKNHLLSLRSDIATLVLQETAGKRERMDNNQFYPLGLEFLIPSLQRKKNVP